MIWHINICKEDDEAGCKNSGSMSTGGQGDTWRKISLIPKGWLAIAKLKSCSLFIPLLLMLKKAFDNVNIEK